MRDAVDALFRTARDGSGGYYAFTCAHGIVDSQQDEHLRAILNGSRYTMPDGMPTVWLGKMKGERVQRGTPPDFFETLQAGPRAEKIPHYLFCAPPAPPRKIGAPPDSLGGGGGGAGGG